MDKMTTCKACGSEIAHSAKTCPQCGAKNKKPFYKAVWFWAVVVVILIIAISSGGSDSEGEYGKTTNGGASDSSTTSTTPERSTYKPGETMTADGYEIDFVSVSDFTAFDEWDTKPESGSKVVVVEFNFKNTGTADQYWDFTDFKCYADSESCEEYYTMADENSGIWSETLSAGRKASGVKFYYEVPENAESIVLEFTPNWVWDSETKVEFILK